MTSLNSAKVVDCE